MDDSTYSRMMTNRLGHGFQGLAAISSAAGNDIDLGQGHAELTESYRIPLHPGHYAVREDLKGADYEMGLGII